MDRRNFLFDVFLAGPKEEFAPLPNFRSIIKDALPKLVMFDPFDQKYAQIQARGQWFDNNLLGLNHSKTMIVMVPEFPMPCVGPEAGIFWSRNHSTAQPLPQLIFIWPYSIKPEWGKEICKKMGIVVMTINEAISALKDYLRIT